MAIWLLGCRYIREILFCKLGFVKFKFCQLIYLLIYLNLLFKTSCTIQEWWYTERYGITELGL